MLESQILRDGCLDALKVWDRDGKLVLLDGHNRLKICNKHNLPYDTSTIEIDSIDEAVIWIVDNQKGRRNVATKEQQDYISGKRYEAEKNVNRARDENGVFKSDAPSSENLDMDNRLHQNKTILKRAAEEGVSHDTISQNQRFAQGVDAIREVSPDLAEKILKPSPETPRITKRAVASLPKLKAADPNKFVETVNELEDAIETKDKRAVNEVVKTHIMVSKKDEEDRRKFQEFNQKVAEKTADAHRKIDEVFGSSEKICFLPNVSELWCEDCQWGFDVFLPSPYNPSCPYCKGPNVSKRDPAWNPRTTKKENKP